MSPTQTEDEMNPAVQVSKTLPKRASIQINELESQPSEMDMLNSEMVTFHAHNIYNKRDVNTQT
jgi:hypothetical protein